MENQSAAAELSPRAQPTRETKREPERVMTLHLTCEASREAFDYEVPGDAGTLKDLWDRRLMVSCPHCRKVHGFLFRTAYVEAMLDGPRLPSERL